MREYRPVYRCRLCGEAIPGAYSAIPFDTAMKHAKHALYTATFVDNPYLGGDKSKIMHKCRDGSVGVADFAGMEAGE